jgi:purine-binding chemotaxis protein CheW
MDADYIDGVGKLDDRLLILLDLNSLLDNDEKEALTGV